MIFFILLFKTSTLCWQSNLLEITYVPPIKLEEWFLNCIISCCVIGVCMLIGLWNDCKGYAIKAKKLRRILIPSLLFPDLTFGLHIRNAVVFGHFILALFGYSLPFDTRKCVSNHNQDAHSFLQITKICKKQLRNGRKAQTFVKLYVFVQKKLFSNQQHLFIALYTLKILIVNCFAYTIIML